MQEVSNEELKMDPQYDLENFFYQFSVQHLHNYETHFSSLYNKLEHADPRNEV